ncbi:hypothetical protein [Methyloglobulus sp.]|uniref:hypothetical protein n=1 Tax=Methyloglobulus sp. TaxID=2518622 RepID=UPI0032B74AA6
MKTIILLFRQNRMASIVVLLVLILAVLVIVINQKGEQNLLQHHVATEQKTKMDKFKSGTYKPAKEIGY